MLLCRSSYRRLADARDASALVSKLHPQPWVHRAVVANHWHARRSCVVIVNTDAALIVTSDLRAWEGWCQGTWGTRQVLGEVFALADACHGRGPTGLEQ